MILFLLIGIVVGGAMGYLIAIVLGKKTIDPASQELHLTLKMEQERSVSLQGDLELLNATVKEERENTLRLNGQNATLTANLLNLKEKLEDQKKEVLELQNKFSMEFKNLANDIFEEKTKKFTEQNKTNLGEILTPLKERIEKFEHQVERNNKESIQWNTALKTQLDISKSSISK